MAKDFCVIRVYGKGTNEAYNALGESAREVGRRLSRPVHIYPFASGFIEEHPAVLCEISQRSDDAFVCPSATAGEFARLAFSGKPSTARDFYRELSAHYNLGDPERRSVSLTPEADAVGS